jgi:hypothetical protein
MRAVFLSYFLLSFLGEKERKKGASVHSHGSDSAESRDSRKRKMVNIPRKHSAINIL